MNENIQKLQEIAGTAAGAFLREYLKQRVDERCDLSNIENEVDLQAAKRARAIIQEDLLDHLTPKAERSSEVPLVNQFD